MRRVQDLGPYEAQFQEIIRNALDKRVFLDKTTPGTPLDDMTIEHGLGYIPIGFLIIRKDKAADFYMSTTAATVSTITIKCTIATVAIRIMIF
jgi:hypothetical protein